MAVTDYLIKSSGAECKYNYSKLKNVVYLVSEEHLKNIEIDNGEAYISGLTELPLRINGFNIQLKEETSLDERYKFQKTLTLSMHGYVNYKIFGGRYYAIIESEDGTFWMVNVDFPSRITHTFNLSKDVNQTDFTFASLSNFPTLKLNADFEAVSPVCLGLNVHGIDTLQLIEFEKARLDTENKVVIYTEDFKKVEYLGNSASFQEVYDGEKVTDTITFDIAFDNYKPSWQWNLLEFLDNRYSAIITPKGGDNKYYPGYNFGLQPSYAIQTASNNDGSDIITVTLVETSSYGTTSAVDWTDEQSTATRWRYVKQINSIICYECVAKGVGRYLVKQEVDAFGNPTGNYMAKDGYEDQYNSKLNIIGTFDDDQQFNTNDCDDTSQCVLESDMPGIIYFNAVTCFTYSVKSNCDWNIGNVPSNLVISPLSGAASSSSTSVSVCQTSTPSSTPIENYFTLQSGNTIKVVNTKTQLETGCLTPSIQNITCLAQTVTFNYNGNCQIVVQNIDQSLTYSITNNTLTVQVPRNYSTSSVTWSITVSNCECSSATTSVSIIQDKTYERWADETGFICESGNSYHIQRRYTGATLDNITGMTDDVRAGTLIEEGDPDCDSSSTQYLFDGNYYCVNGDKYQALEQMISYDSGQTWVKTNRTQLGQMVESASSFCEQDATYKWELSSQWQCYNTSLKLIAIYTGGTIYSAMCDSNTTLTYQNVRPSGYALSAMTDAVVGDCVTSIGDDAFMDCYSLTSVTIPDSVTSIGEYAFINCTTLPSITIPSGVTSISLSTFIYCFSLSSVTIPDTVTSIGDFAFYLCSGLTSINIPDSVTSIGEEPFGFCYSLSSVTIPDSVTSIGQYAFAACSGLTSVTIGSGITSINDYVFNNCSSLPSINIPNSVTSIGQSAFSGCSSLTSIDIPSGVTNIGQYAFFLCDSLTSVTVNATTPPTLGTKALNHTNNCPIYVPSGSVSTYKSASGWSDYADRIFPIGYVLQPKFIATYSDSTSYSAVCDGDTTLTTGDTKPSYSYTAITDAVIGDCVTSIGDYAFEFFRSLSSVTIPDTVTSIGYGAFNRCSGLTSVTIPDSVASIGTYAFSDCKKLESVTIPSGVTSMGTYAFNQCSGLTSVTISNGVTTIGSGAFISCIRLNSVTIPDSVTSIGSGAFGYCSGLTSVTIGSGVTSLNGFNFCYRLGSVTIPDTVTSIGGGAFRDCYSLTNINIPDSVTSIDERAFYQCSGLTSVTIGSGVTSIGKYGFYGCSNLASITCYAVTPPAFGDICLNQTNNCPIYVPSESVDTYKSASGWSAWSSRIRAIPNS